MSTTKKKKMTKRRKFTFPPRPPVEVSPIEIFVSTTLPISADATARLTLGQPWVGSCKPVEVARFYGPRRVENLKRAEAILRGAFESIKELKG